MTEMSDPRLHRTVVVRANRAQRQARSSVARALHGSRAYVRIAAAMVFTGCVIPPSLSVQDGGVNSPPSIMSVHSEQQELPEFSLVTFTMGTGTATLSLLDTDINDNLFVKWFVDYTPTAPTSSRANCAASVTGTPQRTATCDLRGLCTTQDLGQTRALTIVVFDREPLDSGAPAFMVMPPGGLSTDRSYRLSCQSP